MKSLLLIPFACLLCFACSSESHSNKTKAQSEKHSADWSITTKIKAEIMIDTSISAGARFISVSTKNGVVTLSGSVSTKEDRNKIVKIAKSVHGVKKVNNKMTISKK